MEQIEKFFNLLSKRVLVMFPLVVLHPKTLTQVVYSHGGERGLMPSIV